MALPKEERYTYTDYLEQDGKERIELIDGVPRMMAPPSREHQEISGELYRQLANFLGGEAVPGLCRTLRRPSV